MIKGVNIAVKKGGGWATNIFLLITAFYTTVLLSPLIKLPYTNPYGVLGIAHEIQFNPLNNNLRFFFIIFGVPIIFFFLKKIAQLNFALVRLYFIGIIFLYYFFRQLKLYLSKFSNIDMFHDGEQLGVGSAMFLFDKQPFTEMFFLHGFFADPYIAYLSFKLFGYSIGSYYFFNSLLTLLTVLVFYLMLHKLIKNHVLFFTASIFFLGFIPIFTFYQGRELPVFLFLLIIYATATNKLPIFWGAFLTAFISFSALYISIDRGLYIVATGLFFIFLLFIAKSNYPFHLKNILKVIRQQTSLMGGYLLGNISAVGLGIVFFGFKNFGAFLKITFSEIPKFSPIMFDYPYPYFSLHTLFPYWLPIIIITLEVIFIFYLFIYKRSFLLTQDRGLLLAAVVFLVIISYKSALGRSDMLHITYISHILFLAAFLIVDYTILFIKHPYVRLTALCLPLVFFFLPFFNYKNVVNPPSYESHELKIYVSLPKMDDNFWLTDEQEKVRDFILNNTTEKDYLYVFTNEAAYYYLTKRKNPTRFYMNWFASPNFYEPDALKDLIANPPKYIVYTTGFWSDNIDYIPETERTKKINEWILTHYKEAQSIGSTKILILK